METQDRFDDVQTARKYLAVILDRNALGEGEFEQLLAAWRLLSKLGKEGNQ